MTIHTTLYFDTAENVNAFIISIREHINSNGETEDVTVKYETTSEKFKNKTFSNVVKTKAQANQLVQMLTNFIITYNNIVKITEQYISHKDVTEEYLLTY